MKKFLLIALFALCTHLPARTVLISFDGSASLEMWKDTLDYAKANNIKFTYYISAPYFVSENDEFAKSYWAPKELHRTNPVAFRKTERSYGIARRFEFLQRAKAEGHEIGSHLVGHYDGSKWTKEQWHKEIDFFNKTFECAGITKDIVGIRAPELGVNQAYFDAIGETAGTVIRYDTSTVSGKFGKIYDYGKLFEVQIPEIRIINKPTSGYSLPFDYNFHLLDAPDARVKEIFLASMKNYYETTDGPFLICLHFEQMRNGIFYEAMKELVEWMKDKNPTYMTYREYLGV